MKLQRLVLIVFVAFLPAICHAENICPWINAATAFGVIGGGANSPANLSEVTPTTCNFTYKDTAVSHTLLVTVEEVNDSNQTFDSYKTQCGPNASPLRAIGNEAIICPVDKKGHAYGELVIGRVRDKIFTINVSTSAENDPLMTKEAREEKARLVAEQVSGNLF